ncbi:MAG TPA: ATP synthase F0 subunit C [Terriglobia bacterium]
MTRKVMLGLTAITSLLLAAPLFAQGSEAAGGGGASWGPGIAVFGMAIASGLCGLGQGRATASACEGVARNPGARPHIFLFLILGLILIESLALYTLAIVFLKIK